MPYVNLSDLNGKIPLPFLTQALDDSNAKVIDQGIWALIQTQAGNAVDARIGQRYALPLATPYPAVVTEAAVVFACEMIYARRSIAEKDNPWTGQADKFRAMLDEIGAGTIPFTPTLNRADPSASVIAEPAQTTRAPRRSRGVIF